MSQAATEGDLQLLARYSRDHAEDAFAELVRRHLNLVYSAALRQVRSPQLAEEVAQSVFTDLARNAAKLSSGTGVPPVLTAWLFQVTRRTAIDVVRRESRRQLREQIATEMNAHNTDSGPGFQPVDSETRDPPVWSDIEPLLDEAVSALDDTDRAAVLLRYFENKSLREVGQQLGVSDDAAQKRVSRAVERLREFFSKRGVTVGASGLVVVITANAVQAAPVGLAVTIAGAAATLTVTTLATTAITATATKAIAMTALQKTIIGATLAVLAGAGIYEARQASQLHNQVQTLQQQQAPLAEQVQQLQRERDEATSQLAVLHAENERLKRSAAELLKLREEVAALRTDAQEFARQRSAETQRDHDSVGLATKVRLLKQRLEQIPELKIPELQFLTEDDWLQVSQTNRLETEADFRIALSSLRARAKYKFGEMLHSALWNYTQANSGNLPGDMLALQPYFSQPLDEALLQRYRLLHSGPLGVVPKGEPLVVEKEAVDKDYDTRLEVNMSASGPLGLEAFSRTNGLPLGN